MPFVNFRKKFRFFSFDFRQIFDVRTFLRWLSIYGTKFFLGDIKKVFFFKIFTLVLLDGFLDGFSQFRFFICKICILIRDFCVIFKNYSMCMLSIRGNDFIACWAYVEPIHRMLSIRGTNFRACSASGKMWTFLHVQSMLSIRGTSFIAHWAYWELISSHAEHMRNRFHRMLSMRGNV